MHRLQADPEFRARAENVLNPVAFCVSRNFTALGAYNGLVEAQRTLASRALPTNPAQRVSTFCRYVTTANGRRAAYSGTPPIVQFIGQGTVFGGADAYAPFVAFVILWHVLLSRTRLGFATRMIGEHRSDLLNANQQLATALWGGFLLLIMIVRSVWADRLIPMLKLWRGR